MGSSPGRSSTPRTRSLDDGRLHGRRSTCGASVVVGDRAAGHLERPALQGTGVAQPVDVAVQPQQRLLRDVVDVVAVTHPDGDEGAHRAREVGSAGVAAALVRAGQTTAGTSAHRSAPVVCVHFAGFPRPYLVNEEPAGSALTRGDHHRTPTPTPAPTTPRARAAIGDRGRRRAGAVLRRAGRLRALPQRARRGGRGRTPGPGRARGSRAKPDGEDRAPPRTGSGPGAWHRRPRHRPRRRKVDVSLDGASGR